MADRNMGFFFRSSLGIQVRGKQTDRSCCLVIVSPPTRFWQRHLQQCAFTPHVPTSCHIYVNNACTGHCSLWGLRLCLTASISNANRVPSSLLKVFTVQNLPRTAEKWLLYLYMASIGGAQVRHCAAMDGHHGYRGNQGVRQLSVPVLQPLDELGHLQAVLALFALMDSLMWVAVVG